LHGQDKGKDAAMSDAPSSLALRNGFIVDGSGRPGFHGDVLIRDGRIAAVGEAGGRADKEIDVGGAAVAPGFVDVHTHYDAQALWDPLLTPSSNHGITTAIGGNCGFTLAPLSGRAEDADYLLRMLARVEGMSLEALREGVVPAWTSFGEYLDHLEGKLAINAGFLVGHSALRVAVMGARAVGEEATPEEIQAMRALLAQGLAAGGLGFSTTISPGHKDMEGQPVPSRWATREELVALAEVVGDYPGTWLEMVPGSIEFTERDYGPMTEMALAAGRPLNWNVYIISSDKPEGFASQLAATDHARARGASVFGLVQAGPSKLRINLMSGQMLDAFPAWAQVFALSHPEKLRAFADPEVRARLAAAPKAAGGGASWMFRDWGLLSLEETRDPAAQPFVGRKLADYARAVGKAPLDALLDLAVADDLRTGFAPPPPGTDAASWRLRAQAGRDEERCVVGGSDAGAHLDMIDAFTLPSRMLGEAVRERGLLGLEEAVRLITCAPARRFGLRDRGRLAPGLAADVVVFDPATIAVGPMTTRADLPAGGLRLYADALGVHQVIVGGQVVLDHGAPTGARPGAILRSGRDTETVTGAPA
jgi:N-acyl-D-aspartate/D-glutamate deacylase